ncbi:OmpA family protein, partial [uncultured Alistipes sp.]
MKKLILLFAAVALATSAWAQDTPKKPSFAGFVSNGFWDNWEITVGAGAGTALSNGTNPGSFGNRINFEANFGLTKWFHPVTGMRIQLQGGRFANYDAAQGKMTWPYLFVHTDFMLNFSNWVGGYREDRAYYAVPFAGFGYMASNFTDSSHEDNLTGTHQSFAFTLGWLNKFRLSPSFDFNIELKGLIAPSRVSPVAMDGSYMFGFSATAGFTYRFNKRGWQRGVAGYTAADIQAFQDAVAASMATAAAMEVENAQLAQQLAASQAELAAT